MKKQTSVNFLINELSDILGVLHTTPMQNLLLVDAINKARAMHEDEVSDAWVNGNDCEPKEVTEDYARRYYKQTFKTK